MIKKRMSKFSNMLPKTKNFPTSINTENLVKFQSILTRFVLISELTKIFEFGDFCNNFFTKFLVVKWRVYN